MSIKLTFCLAAIALLGAMGCTPPQTETSENTAEPVAETSTETTSEGTGTLAVKANGEDFVRQGFTTKDGWEIEFDNLYVTLANVTAYQTDPPFDPQGEAELEPQETVLVSDLKTVDLAAGDETAEPIVIDTQTAASGHYNALSWQMAKATEGDAQGHAIVLAGTAQKAGETIDFVLKLDPELTFTCGEFVGDSRKGFLEPEDTADLEATFHFDHLFGDGEAPADDDINTGALGFDPIANLAENGKVEADTAMLEQQLSPEDYAKLESILPSLGHVGEGHCRANS